MTKILQSQLCLHLQQWLFLLLSFEVFPQRHRTVHLSVQSTNKMKCTFEPCTHYCHIHLACTSVRYERKVHVLIIRK